MDIGAEKPMGTTAINIMGYCKFINVLMVRLFKPENVNGPVKKKIKTDLRRCRRRVMML